MDFSIAYILEKGEEWWVSFCEVAKLQIFPFFLRSPLRWVFGLLAFFNCFSRDDRPRLCRVDYYR